MAGADVATVPTDTEAIFGSLLFSVGRKGAAGEDTGAFRSQGWVWGVAQHPSSMGAFPALMSAIAAIRLQQQTDMPSQAILNEAAAWPVRPTISSTAINKHMVGLRFK